MAKREPQTQSNDSDAKAPLKRRWWLNLALFLIVAGLAFFVWHQAGEEKKDTRAPLTTVAASSIQHIEVATAEQPPFQLTHDKGRWRLLTPIKARASAFAVDALLQLLHAPVEAAVGPATGDLGRFGLKKPMLVVKLDAITIEFGQPHPIKDWQYVRYGDNIYLIPGGHYPHATRNYLGFIDSRLIEEDRKPIAFQLPGFKLALKDGTWQREPNDANLSSDRINALVDEWRHAHALQVTPVTAAQTIKERVAVSFESADNKPSTLVFGVLSRRPELVLVRSDEGLAYHFPPETGDRMLTLTAEPAK